MTDSLRHFAPGDRLHFDPLNPNADRSELPIPAVGVLDDPDVRIARRHRLQADVWLEPRRPYLEAPGQRLKRLSTFERVLGYGFEHRLGQPSTLELEVAMGDAAYADIEMRRVIRTQFEGGGHGQMWVVKSREETNSGAPTAKLNCVVAWMDLAEASLVEENLDDATYLDSGRVDLTPREAVEWALSAYRGGWEFEVGEVFTDERIQLLETQRDNSYSLLLKVAEAAQGRLRFTWDDDRSVWLVHLDDVNAPPIWGGKEVRTGQDLTALSHQEEHDFGSRFYPEGGDGSSMAEAVWPVVGIQGVMVTLAGTDGESGIVPEDDAGWFVGCKLRAVGSDRATEIVRSWGSLDRPTTFQLASSRHGFYLEDRLQLLSPEGHVLAYVDHPQAVRRHGPVVTKLRREKIVGLTNLLRNADMRWDGVGAAPPGWEVIGTPEVTRAVGREVSEFGGSAAKVVASAQNQGLRSAPFRWVKSDRRQVLATLVSLVLWGGKIRLYLRNEETGATYPEGAIASAWHSKEDGTGDPERRSLGIGSDLIPDGVYRLYIVSRGPAVFAVDAATAAPWTSAIEAITLGSGPEDLTREAVRQAILEHTPRRRFKLDLIPLYELDPVRYAEEEIEVGASVRVYDETLQQGFSSRVVGYSVRMRSGELSASVELSDDRRDLVDLLGGRSYQYRWAGVPGKLLAEALQRAKISVISAPTRAGSPVRLTFRAFKSDGAEITGMSEFAAPTVRLISTGELIPVAYDAQIGYTLAADVMPRFAGDHCEITVPATQEYLEAQTLVAVSGGDALAPVVRLIEGPWRPDNYAHVNWRFKILLPHGAGELMSTAEGERPVARLVSSGATVSLRYSQTRACWETNGEVYAAIPSDSIELTVPAGETHTEYTAVYAIGNASLPQPQIDILDGPRRETIDAPIVLRFRVRLPSGAWLTSTEADKPTAELFSGMPIPLEFDSETQTYAVQGSVYGPQEGDSVRIRVPGTAEYSEVVVMRTLPGRPYSTMIQLRAEQTIFHEKQGDTNTVRFAVFKDRPVYPIWLLRDIDVPAGDPAAPSARLQSTGQPVAIQRVIFGTMLESYLEWETEAFQANPAGDTLLISVPEKAGRWVGSTLAVAIPPVKSLAPAQVEVRIARPSMGGGSLPLVAFHVVLPDGTYLLSQQGSPTFPKARLASTGEEVALGSDGTFEKPGYWTDAKVDPFGDQWLITIPGVPGRYLAATVAIDIPPQPANLRSAPGAFAGGDASRTVRLELADGRILILDGAICRIQSS